MNATRTLGQQYRDIRDTSKNEKPYLFYLHVALYYSFLIVTYYKINDSSKSVVL